MAISKARAAEVNELSLKGISLKDIALTLGMKESSVRRYLRYSRESVHNKAKILLLDIETSPLIFALWGTYKQQPRYDQIIKDWCVLSWAAKWLYEPEIFSDVIDPDGALHRNDEMLLCGIWHLMDKADIIVAHNAINFDIRKLNSRFMTNKFPPYSPYQVIDTLKGSQRVFAHPSHKLAYLTEHFKLSEKLHTEFELWLRCCESPSYRVREKALEEMLIYNKHDILALEDYYLMLRPWIPSHPNVNLYLKEIDSRRCTRCGSSDIKRHGYYITPAGRFNAVRCSECGGYSRERIGELTKKDRENLLISTAR